MDTNLSSQQYAEKLPNPNSPLPAWPHYEILKFAEGVIYENFKGAKYDGHIISLGIEYALTEDDDQEPETWYQIIFGNGTGVWPGKSEPMKDHQKETESAYETDPQESSSVGESEIEDPFGEFTIKLHGDVYLLIDENLTHHSKLHVRMEAAAVDSNGAVSMCASQCMICTNANHAHRGSQRLHKWSLWRRTWNCTGSTCTAEHEDGR